MNPESIYRLHFSNSQDGFQIVIATTGRASARPMTGSAKQSMAPQVKAGLLRRFRLRSLSYGGQVAPRNDGV
jgi:hypothetical protein